jgi:regulation of enolase protein 1 (concanavalin A-like superfamily)
MNNLILILIITLPLTLLGQGWEQTYGGIDHDWGTSGKQTSYGGYIITGSTSSFGNGSNDVWLIYTDSQGDSIWTKTFGGVSYDRGNSVQQTTDGGYIITGETQSFGNGQSDVYLIKTDNNGDTLWTKTFGGLEQDEGRSVQQTNDGGYIIAGNTMSNVYLIKTDNNGDTLWTKTFGGGLEQDEGRSVQQTNDGGYIICGSRLVNINNICDVYLIKTDNNGDSIWTKTFGGVENDEGYSVQQTNDGGYVITGETESFGIGNGESDVWLIKTDGNGTEQWNQTFGGVDHDEGKSVQQTTDGGYIITGYTNSFGNGESDVWLVKTDSQGDSIWTKTFGGNEQDGGSSVQQTIDGGYVIIGYTDDPFVNGGVEDLFVIKTDGNGNITSTFEIPLPNPNRKLEKTINLNGQEIKPQTNTPIIEIYDDGSVEKKLIIEK